MARHEQIMVMRYVLESESMLQNSYGGNYIEIF